ECEQDVSRQAAVFRIARIDKDHPTDDNRPGAIERSSHTLHAIYGFVRLDRIEIPEDVTIFGAVGTNVSIQRAGEDRAGNRCHGAGLRGTTAGLDPHGAGGAYHAFSPDSARRAVRPPPWVGSKIDVFGSVGSGFVLRIRATSDTCT